MKKTLLYFFLFLAINLYSTDIQSFKNYYPFSVDEETYEKIKSNNIKMYNKHIAPLINNHLIPMMKNIVKDQKINSVENLSNKSLNKQPKNSSNENIFKNLNNKLIETSEEYKKYQTKLEKAEKNIENSKDKLTTYSKEIKFDFNPKKIADEENRKSLIKKLTAMQNKTDDFSTKDTINRAITEINAIEQNEKITSDTKQKLTSLPIEFKAKGLTIEKMDDLEKIDPKRLSKAIQRSKEDYPEARKALRGIGKFFSSKTTTAVMTGILLGLILNRKTYITKAKYKQLSDELKRLLGVLYKTCQDKGIQNLPAENTLKKIPTQTAFVIPPPHGGGIVAVAPNVFLAEINTLLNSFKKIAAHFNYTFADISEVDLIAFYTFLTDANNNAIGIFPVSGGVAAMLINHQISYFLSEISGLITELDSQEPRERLYEIKNSLINIFNLLINFNQLQSLRNILYDPAPAGDPVNNHTHNPAPAHDGNGFYTFQNNINTNKKCNCLIINLIKYIINQDRSYVKYPNLTNRYLLFGIKKTQNLLNYIDPHNIGLTVATGYGLWQTGLLPATLNFGWGGLKGIGNYIFKSKKN